MYNDIPIDQLQGHFLEDVKEAFPGWEFLELIKDGEEQEFPWDEKPYRVKVETEDEIITKVIGFS